MPSGRKSLGKVRLRRANGTLMLTVPKSVAPKVESLVDKIFECTFTQTDGLEMIIYARKKYTFHTRGE